MGRTIRNKKAKGTSAENELIKMFWSHNWVSVRVAGSGSGRYPSPDILASRGDKKIVLEVKVIKDYKKYFNKKEIDDLAFFAEKFCAEAWVGVKFYNAEWWFLPLSELSLTPAGNYSLSLATMKIKGFKFEEMIS